MTFNLKQLFAIAISSAVAFQAQTAQASSIFQAKEVDQDDFALMATPYNNGYSHQLTVLGQMSNEKACWEETGQAPTLINPLLLEFDFSNICARGTDSNGYSIRMDGEDMFTRYIPKVISKDGELQLIAHSYRPGLPDMVIARSHGPTTEFSKLIFESDWRLTQRTFEEKSLGHFYLTHGNEPAPPAVAEASSVETVQPLASPSSKSLAEIPAPIAAPRTSAQSIFDEHAVDSERIALMATPYNGGYSYQLTVLEQVSDDQQCWSESGMAPLVIDPLLLNFDFSGICRRGTDSNGYSIRVNGQDLYSRYTPKVVEQAGELMLVAHPNRPNDRPFTIARSSGPAANFSKLMLEPGWEITKRGYEGKALGHFYLSNTQPLASLTADDASVAQR